MLDEKELVKNMYNTEYVNKILDEYKENLRSNVKRVCSSEEYRDLAEWGSRSLDKRITKIYKAVKDSVPIEIEMDYVFLKTIPIGDKEKPKGMRIRIFGSEDNLAVFDFNKDFESENSDQEIVDWIADIFVVLIKNEYAVVNLNLVNEMMETYCRRARVTYKVVFTIDLTGNKGILNKISKHEIILNADIDCAISITNTMLFEARKKVLKKNVKTSFDLEMIDSLRGYRSVITFMESNYPILKYLTNSTRKLKIKKLLQDYYSCNKDEVENKINELK